MNDRRITQILITGGGGYVGAVLVPLLLREGYRVRVLDLFLFGRDVFPEVAKDPRLELVQGDLRDVGAVSRAVAGVDAVIHLACISNDPSFELDPTLGKSINYDAFLPLVRAAKQAGVRRFVYASSSSVYGVQDAPKVTEDLPLKPLTDYAKYKAMCEEVLLAERAPGFTCLILRPATVCGYSPRLRLDLTVNILTSQAVNRRKITVFGGDQLRPNIHIQDMAAAYLMSLRWLAEKIDGKIFNVGYENHSVRELAEMVQRIVGPDVQIETQPTKDLRSYRITSDKIRNELGFVPRRTIQDAVQDLAHAFKEGKIPDPLDNIRYYNIKTMQARQLK